MKPEETEEMSTADKEALRTEIRRENERVFNIYKEIDYEEPSPEPACVIDDMALYEVSPPGEHDTAPEYIVAEIQKDLPGFWELLGTRYVNQGADVRLRHTGTRRLWRMEWRTAQGYFAQHPKTMGRACALFNALHAWLKARE